MSVGQFLKDKTNNMLRWLDEEGCGAPVLAPDALRCTILAQMLHDKCDGAIQARSFEQLEEHKENLPVELAAMLSAVQERADLHDKFWRYLELFSTAVS